jgi:nucleoside-diphosphate-sugar epimerase
LFRLRLSGALQHAHHPSATKVNESTIYTHPTIDSLAALVSGEETDAITIETAIEKYSQGLDGPILHNEPLPKDHLVVLLTGSTGNLGAEILLRLLENDNVQTVYALNRKSSGATSQQRHEERFKDRGFDTSLLSSSKLVFLEGESSQDHLGLEHEIYDTVKASVTTIIHNAWRLDFNLSLASFEPHVRGTRNLIDLARAGKYGANVRFIFTSSVASAQSWDARLGKYPEEHLEDVKYARGGGYGESKYAAERVSSPHNKSQPIVLTMIYRSSKLAGSMGHLFVLAKSPAVLPMAHGLFQTGYPL